MSRRRRFLLVIAGVAVVAVVTAVLLRAEREPEYGGKRLSEWVDPTFWSAYPFSQGTSIQGMPNEVADAIRQTGTKAIPYLLTWIQYEPPAWKKKSFMIINGVFHWAL